MSWQSRFVFMSLVVIALCLSACGGESPTPTVASIVAPTEAPAVAPTEAPTAAPTDAASASEPMTETVTLTGTGEISATEGVTATGGVSATENMSTAESISETVSGGDLSGVLTGTVLSRERIALAAGSVITVQLQDVSLADAPAKIIAGQTITTTGENVPIPFTITYDPAQIDERFTYALKASITIDGKLSWINTQQYAVLTRGAPLTGVEVVVEAVQ